VVSFDKRGVGESDGCWWLAGIEDQASDVAACIGSVREVVGTTPKLGLFGHSQGGWVVVEAAARGLGAAFVISNSGPGVSPVVQERFAAETRMRTAGMSARVIAEMRASYDDLIDLARSGAAIGAARERVGTTVHDQGHPDTWIDLAGHESSWQMMRRLASYDPEPALTATRAPLLVIYGASDPLVPVEASERALRTCVPSEHLSVRVLAGADHRLQTGDPPTLSRDYFDTLDAFLARVLRT
jgi:pimeloyl-ACP methyl ester carboxylesterase